MTDDLYAQVRRALTHLYDAVYLQRSPLLRYINSVGSKPATRDARALRQALIEAIETLKPDKSFSLQTDEQRAYLALRDRYVEQIEVTELAADLGISERQLRREIRAGIEAVAQHFRARAESTATNPTAEPSPTLDLEAFADASTNLAAEARDLMLLVAPLARESGAVLIEVELPESLMVRGSRVLLRQALLGLFSRVLQLHPGDLLQVGASAQEEVIFWVAPAQQLAASDTPSFALIDNEILVALGARVQHQRQPSGRPQYQLVLQPAALQTILVIDDNESLHRLFRRYLTGLPYTVVSAHSAEEGLSLAQKQPPDLVLLDLMMPHRDGWDVLRSLRTLPQMQHTPVVICSVLSHEELARSLAVAGYLKKPISQDALVQMVQSLLERRPR